MESLFKPMLCGSTDVVPDGDNWQIEPKFDGWRMLCLKNDANVLTVIGGRNEGDYTNQAPQIENALDTMLPDNVDTLLDCELIHKTRGWNGVQSVMTSGQPTLDADLVLIVFDVLLANDTDVRGWPLRERRPLIEGIVQGQDNVLLSPLLNGIDDPLKQALAWRFEGVVCKRLDSKYVSGTRSPYWLKVKPQTTCEARVIGFKPGTGSRAGSHGAFKVELLDNGAQTTCKIQDPQHKDVNANESRWLGAVIEIAHHGLGASGKPRHPQYLRRRDDR